MNPAPVRGPHLKSNFLPVVIQPKLPATNPSTTRLLNPAAAAVARAIARDVQPHHLLVEALKLRGLFYNMALTGGVPVHQVELEICSFLRNTLVFVVSFRSGAAWRRNLATSFQVVASGCVNL